MRKERRQSFEPHLPDLFTRKQWEKVAEHVGLPPRQLQIARLMCRGCTNGEIAAQLGIAFDTIRTHTRALYQRLEITSRVGVPVRLVLAHPRLQRKAQRSNKR